MSSAISAATFYAVTALTDVMAHGLRSDHEWDYWIPVVSVVGACLGLVIGLGSKEDLKTGAQLPH